MNLDISVRVARLKLSQHVFVQIRRRDEKIKRKLQTHESDNAMAKKDRRLKDKLSTKHNIENKRVNLTNTTKQKLE